MWYVDKIIYNTMEYSFTLNCSIKGYSFVLKEVGTNKQFHGSFKDILKRKPLGVAKITPFGYGAVVIRQSASKLVSYIKDIRYTDIVIENDIALEIDAIKHQINELYYLDLGNSLRCILNDIIFYKDYIDFDVIRRNSHLGYFIIRNENEVKNNGSSLAVLFNDKFERYMSKLLTLRG